MCTIIKDNIKFVSNSNKNPVAIICKLIMFIKLGLLYYYLFKDIATLYNNLYPYSSPKNVLISRIFPDFFLIIIKNLNQLGVIS